MVEPLTVLIVILLAVVLLLASILVPSAEGAIVEAICSLLGCSANDA
ncbi:MULTISPECIES: hypothetical protein [Cytobacillus]|jgi:hypothetical protein|uniref:Uncharacterized protein n=3 Tax=Cytobacillus TaxID=2675230 RepID=A0A366K244_CYTFI|nr:MULTISPECIES: hypothetical protein [Cytobacillus]MDM5224662.1 hypothetical protein [Cytobacillus sp. NJ13]MBU8729398.1 hypothetical protein [Cytobacillus oceanisediminis]MBU8769893.1 hypothetical protein [Cytobacillus oceanisediminis]MBX9974940.1 hypothetical protein [Cytobacillus firmus]MBY0155164.1 hypothetical protein [Cytobacillus firmus]